MNENLLTLKQIAEQTGVNYKTLLSCKGRLEEFIQGLPVGRTVKYSDKLADFFRLVFALSDEGYSTERIRNLLVNGVVAEEDAFIESWLEEWRTMLRLNGAPPGSEQKQADGLTNRLTDGLTDRLTDRLTGPRPDPLTGWMTDGPTELLTDGLADCLTDGPTELLTHGMTASPTHRLTDRLTDSPTDRLTDRLTDSPTDPLTDGMAEPPAVLPTGGPTDSLIETHLEQYDQGQAEVGMDQTKQDWVKEVEVLVVSLLTDQGGTMQQILQKMATQSNIAITALCEASEDIRKSILALDTRLSRMEKDLDMEDADPLELYQVKAENYQVDLPEISPPVFQDQDKHQENDLVPVKNSITDGVPDREKVVEWIITRREEDLQANSYSALAAVLNEAEIPTMTGRANWSKGTIRNLIVRKKAEQC